MCVLVPLVPWSVLNIFDDTHDMWGFFHNILQICLDTHASMKKVCYKKFNHPHHGWLRIFSLLFLQNIMQNAMLNVPMTRDVDHYKSIKNSLKIMICSAKLEYIRSLLTHSHHSPKFTVTLWSEVNEIIGWCQSHKSSLCSALMVSFILWLLQMTITLPNPIWHQLPHFALISLTDSALWSTISLLEWPSMILAFILQLINALCIGLSRLCRHNFKHNRGWKA